MKGNRYKNIEFEQKYASYGYLKCVDSFFPLKKIFDITSQNFQKELAFFSSI